MSQFLFEKEREILNIKLRKQIYDLVKKFSGCNFHDLKRKSNIPTSTLQYHLNYLTRHNLITAQRDGNKIRYFTHKINLQNKQLLIFLRQKNIRNILLLILNHKKCSQRNLTNFLNLSPSTISWYLSKLIKSSIIKVIKAKKESYYTLHIKESEIISLLITYKESFLDKLVDQTMDMWSF